MLSPSHSQFFDGRQELAHLELGAGITTHAKAIARRAAVQPMVKNLPEHHHSFKDEIRKRYGGMERAFIDRVFYLLSLKHTHIIH
jgi:hypothetical protein